MVSTKLPPPLQTVIDKGLLTESQTKLANDLCSDQLGQSHLFQAWQGATLAQQLAGMEQLQDLDGAYKDGGGLAGYIRNAVDLLENSRKGLNPLEEWQPSVPKGELFQLATPQYNATQAVGIEALGSVGFVLVAGGLGERLGYSSIKVRSFCWIDSVDCHHYYLSRVCAPCTHLSHALRIVIFAIATQVGLPIEMATETPYLKYYIQYILSIQKKHAPAGKKLPLCIMTSGDTNERTVQLLKTNNYFGMDQDQITIVQQGKGVPALLDNHAKIATDPDCPTKIVTKPHGHGDIHALLYSAGVAKKWLAAGCKWLVLFQDTNGLAFHTLPLMLGVSTKLDLIMNSLAVPRKAKQAIGGIAKLHHKKNGEYK